MTHVLHLIDDAGLGGVTRVLADHLPRLGEGFVHEVRQVATHWRLPNAPGADIVVVHFTLSWSRLPFLAVLRVRLGRRPLVIVEHSYTASYERLRVARRARFRAMLRLGYGLADRVVAVSRAQADWLVAARLAGAAKLRAIPQACDTARLAALPEVAAAGPLRLGAFGRYCDQKGFDGLIAAMRRIAPTVATLELAGDGPDLPALRQAAAGLEHVHIGGPVDPAAFLARVDALVVPSRWEAYGLVAAEARAAARPVLAARTDGLVEQVDPACGILFAPDDPADLADAIHALAGRDLAAMGRAGRRSVAGALEATLAGWRQLLGELAAPPARRTA